MLMCAQFCLSNCKDCSLPGSSVHEIFPARILESAISYFRISSQELRDQTHILALQTDSLPAEPLGSQKHSIRFSISVHCNLLIPIMSMFTLAISCLITSNLPGFMDLTFQVPMQHCSLQPLLTALYRLYFRNQSHPQLSVVFALAQSLHPFWSYFSTLLQ